MMKSGKREDTGRGYKTFQPTPLFEIEKELDISKLYSLVEKSSIALGELRALDTLLPNPELLIERYALKEALLSSQIEGTQSTLVEVIENQNVDDSGLKVDIVEVKNYLKALNYGVDAITQGVLPLSNRLIKKCHNILMNNVRGGEPHKTKGEFRRSQNYIGGNKPSNAVFVPPREDTVIEMMSDLEKYIHNGEFPDVIKSALIHYQFETIHPFLDGNGRIGRLFIILYLIEKRVIHSQTLYLSLYLKKHKMDYYELLTNVRENGDYIKWITFFLNGIIAVCEQIMKTTKNIIRLKDEDTKKLKGENEYKLLDLLFLTPRVDVKTIKVKLGVSNQTANMLVKKFEDKGILKSVNTKQRYRKFIYSAYIYIIEAEL